MGQIATAGGIVISIFTAYLVMNSPTIMDYMQLIFSFFNAPLFATFLLGMFWTRCSPWGAFWGLLFGITTAIVHWYFTDIHKVFHYESDMAGNFWRATIAWVACFLVTILVSFFTKPKPREELVGLVYGVTERPKVPDMPFYKQPVFLAVIVGLVCLLANIVFW
jgi:SSS family solute:Na+ symporter